MTEKLYDSYPYLKSFEAVVTSCERDGDLNKVTLNATCFFPEEGGQSCDKGSLNGFEVLKVSIKNGEIYHYISEALNVGEKVTGEIDWEHRYFNMQMHSAEHIFSGLVFSKYAFNNVGFHLSENNATMDYDGKLTDENISELEYMVNKAITENVPIIARYPSKEEISDMSYRSKKVIEGAIRIVTVEGYDVCACCALHVSHTGEIGLFKVISWENYKAGVRIHYLAGFRALMDYRAKNEALKDIYTKLNVKAGEEVQAVCKLSDENQKLKYDIVSLKNEIVKRDIEAKALKEPCFNGIWVGNPEDGDLMKYAISELHKHYEGTCFAFAGSDESGYRFLIESGYLDLSVFLKALKERFEVKGGGRPDCIQGSVNATLKDIDDFIFTHGISIFI